MVTLVKCPDCKGWGDKPGVFTYCETCNGLGMVPERNVF